MFSFGGGEPQGAVEGHAGICDFCRAPDQRDDGADARDGVRRSTTASRTCSTTRAIRFHCSREPSRRAPIAKLFKDDDHYRINLKFDLTTRMRRRSSTLCSSPVAPVKRPPASVVDRQHAVSGRQLHEVQREREALYEHAAGEHERCVDAGRRASRGAVPSAPAVPRPRRSRRGTRRAVRDALRRSVGLHCAARRAPRERAEPAWSSRRSGVQFVAHGLPGDVIVRVRSRFASPSFDLARPCRFDVRLGLAVKAREQVGRKLRALGERQLQGVMKHLAGTISHVCTIPASTDAERTQDRTTRSIMSAAVSEW